MTGPTTKVDSPTVLGCQLTAVVQSKAALGRSSLTRLAIGGAAVWRWKYVPYSSGIAFLTGPL